MAGVLSKYDWGKAWRPRLFVLRGGVLGYWHLAPTGAPRAAAAAAAAGALLDALRAEGGDVTLVGAQAALLDAAWRRRPPGDDGAPTPVPDPAGEIALQVARFTASRSDDRKFYVHTGNRTVALRAESPDDAWAWLTALGAAKAALPAASPGVRVGGGGTTPVADPALAAADRERLAALGAPPAALAAVEALLAAAAARAAAALADADRARMRVAALTNERRALETELVVERELANRAAGARTPGAPGSAPRPSRLASADTAASAWTRDRDESDGDASTDGGAGARAGGTGEGGSTTDDDGSFVDAASDAGSRDAGDDAAGEQRTRTLADLPTPAWLAALPPPPPRRTALPPPAQAERTHSLWTIIKECVGKDLTRICLPVYFNEPLSALQKTAEDMEYSSLLDDAACFPRGSVSRALRVAAFAASGYACSAPHRTSKPFNPLLGETYELVRPDLGFRFVSEKVVHHPTVIAAAAEGRAWRFEGDADVRSKFTGRAIELTPVGLLTITFDDGERFTWSKSEGRGGGGGGGGGPASDLGPRAHAPPAPPPSPPPSPVTTSINNLIIGRLRIDHGGAMRVASSDGLAVRLKFCEAGLLSRAEPHRVVGHVERGGVRLPHPTIAGHWDAGLDAVDARGVATPLWRRAPPPPDPTRYQLTSFALTLNEITPLEAARLAPTDSRLRPDQAHLERGEHDAANAAKLRLETKQRAARAAAERGDPLRPRWFPRVPGAVQGVAPAYAFNGEYWGCWEAAAWPGCRNIFGDEMETVSEG